MSEYTFKMPDLGEGTVEAEIVAWRAKPGDSVREDEIVVEVMTDKAAVEVPAPVTGRIVSIRGAPGEKIAVGSPLIVFDLRGERADAVPPAPVASGSAGRVMASPANRRRAREAGIDLADVRGSGPGGRILRTDLADGASAAGGDAGSTEIKIIGLRRLIAERMSEAKRTIPHFAYVEEADVTELEALRRRLNGELSPGEAPLTYLPFVILALTRVLQAFPQCNATYDAARAVVLRHRAVHVGVATQTADGLKVPVVRDAQRRSLWELAAEIRRLADRARSNQATRDELQGSTVTVTSLGKLGGIASTPIINAPEVAIIGLNKAVERPVVRDGAVVVRRIMNLSSSFDHRFVDGHDAAAMIQALKDFIENPATIFLPSKVTAP